MSNRENEAYEALLIDLGREYGSTSKKGISDLAKVGMESLAVRSFVQSDESFNLAEAVAWANASDLGSMIADAENRRSNEPDIKELPDLDSMSPQQQINWARANGCA